MNSENEIKLILLSVRGIVSKLNLKNLKTCQAYDVTGLIETPNNEFDSNEFVEHEVFTGLIKLCLKGLAL